MGVINNLIAIRRKFRAIVGANWDGTTLDIIASKNPPIVILDQPSNIVSGGTAVCRVNKNGVIFQVVLPDFTPTGQIATSLTKTLQRTIATVGSYRYAIADGDRILYSDVFTVSAPAPQTTSAKQNMSESLETDVIKEDLTTDETPVAEKATTTKKGN